MSEPARPAIQFTLTVSLPESATDEQRESFRRAFEEQGIASSMTITISMPASATDEQRESFHRLLKEQGVLLVSAGEADPKDLETKPV